MRAAKMTMGKGAVVSVLSSRLHPSKLIRDRWPNPEKSHRVENLVVLRQELKKINREDQLALILTHEAFKDGGEYIELYASHRWCVLQCEGDPDFFFTCAAEGEQFQPEVRELLPVEIREISERAVLDEEEVRIARELVEIDDDNEPAPENMPQQGVGVAANDVFGEWGHEGTCYRRMAGGGLQDNPRLIFPAGIRPTLLQLFEILFPKNYILQVILPMINMNLRYGGAVEYWEFLQWIGIWLLIATIQGPERKDFWSTDPISKHGKAPFRITEMSRNRFDEILFCLRYTDDLPPTYRDPFFEIRKLVEAWNDNMAANFQPGGISCLDESMSTWANKYTCPGFMFVPRKPWPFGNEYHTIACGICEILYGLELVEGKDEPKAGRGPKQFDNLGKTVGLLLRLTRSIWGTAKVVVLDSGFCVLQALVELKKRGVYAAALIKKRRYWPKWIPGDDIINYFVNKEVGAVDALPGKLNNIPFHVFAMKEPDYVMKLMSTYGTNERVGVLKNRSYKVNGVLCESTFKYPEIVHNHFKYRHIIDDHNAKRHSPISLEVVWATKWWPHRVFAFLLAVTEVNIMLASVYFGNYEKSSMLNFRKSLSLELMFNPYIPEEESEELRRSPRNEQTRAHLLRSLPRGKKFSGAATVNAKIKYPQAKCRSCKKRVRTYCVCSPGILRCDECYAQHIIDVETTSEHTELNSVAQNLLEIDDTESV
jgi:Transposase IS4